MTPEYEDEMRRREHAAREKTGAATEWTEDAPTSPGWWWHYSYYAREVRPLKVIEITNTPSGVPMLCLAIHGGSVFDTNPGMWRGKLDVPSPPSEPVVSRIVNR